MFISKANGAYKRDYAFRMNVMEDIRICIEILSNYPGSVAFYNTQPGNEVGLFYNAYEPTQRLCSFAYGTLQI